MSFLMAGGSSAPSYSAPIPPPSISNGSGMSVSAQNSLIDERRRKRFMALATTPGNAANYTAGTLGSSSVLGG